MSSLDFVDAVETLIPATADAHTDAGAPAPSWYPALEAVHTSARAPVALAADFALLTVAAVGAGLQPLAAVVMAAASVSALLVSRSYVGRDPVQTQGVLWYPSSPALSLAVVTLAAVAGGGTIGVTPVIAVRFAAVALLGLVGLRMISWSVISRARRRGVGLHPTVIVGTGASARLVRDKLIEYREAGLDPVEMLPLAALAHRRRFLERLRANDARHVVLAPEVGDDALVASLMTGCEGLDTSFSLLPPMADLFLHPGHVSQVGGLPLIPLGRVHRRSSLPGKRIFDLVLASLALVAFAPVLAVVAIAIRLDDKGPVFYRQRRVGRQGRLFGMLKFRSMVVGADRLIIDLRHRNVTDGLLFKLRDDPRVTRVGRFIRRTSMDELPQLWNVIKGEMSLVGPRPLPVSPTEFGPIDNERHRVLPGITGYWQLAGGPGLTYQEMVKLDLAYIQNWSLWLDVRLLLRTIPALVYRHGPC
ncbi:MAG TPA: exopolysaccharide biosynthesis polyprenyl glycosylphosphotransferase [Acidimicrobiales bacterium]|nr:exopolysaccharide biosynthesis polyprenyl glycosylphosphotransferase [Acidimicrobiales bacterium]